MSGALQDLQKIIGVHIRNKVKRNQWMTLEAYTFIIDKADETSLEP